MSFQVGDVVIPIYFPFKGVCTVSEVYEFKVFNSGNHVKSTFIYRLGEWCFELWHKAHELRHATPEEIAAGHRIDKPELEVLNLNDVSPNAKVIEK